MDALAAAGVSLIAVDEAHCISEWATPRTCWAFGGSVPLLVPEVPASAASLDDPEWFVLVELAEGERERGPVPGPQPQVVREPGADQEDRCVAGPRDHQPAGLDLEDRAARPVHGEPEEAVRRLVHVEDHVRQHRPPPRAARRPAAIDLAAAELEHPRDDARARSISKNARRDKKCRI